MLMRKKMMCWLCLGLIFLLTEQAWAVDGWTTFKDEEAYSISFQRIYCDDSSNGVAFDFYAIRLENKSDRQLNLQWFNTSEDTDRKDENYVSLILAPGEIQQGNCGHYASTPLMVLAKNSTSQPHFSDFKFYLL